jgi:hypothetical protein
MSEKNPKKEPQSGKANLIDFNLFKEKKDTAEIARFVAQQICEDCIDEYHKIKSRSSNR